jgi:hypothetical protein
LQQWNGRPGLQGDREPLLGGGDRLAVLEEGLVAKAAPALEQFLDASWPGIPNRIDGPRLQTYLLVLHADPVSLGWFLAAPEKVDQLFDAGEWLLLLRAVVEGHGGARR